VLFLYGFWGCRLVDGVVLGVECVDFGAEGVVCSVSGRVSKGSI